MTDSQEQLSDRLEAHERFAISIRHALRSEEWADDFEASVLEAFNNLNADLKSMGGKWYANV